MFRFEEKKEFSDDTYYMCTLQSPRFDLFKQLSLCIIQRNIILYPKFVGECWTQQPQQQPRCSWEMIVL